MLSLLWLREEDYLYVAPQGRLLIQAREMFKHRTAAHKSFIGYAYGQLKRMTNFGPGAFSGYMGAKRKALVEKFGYDTKNAAHLIRLLHMGEEYLRTGQMNVRREHDVDLILAVKRGEWPLAEVQRYADECFQKCHAAFEASEMPQAIDFDRVNALVARIVDENGC